MERIFLGDRQVAGFTLDVGQPTGCCGVGFKFQPWKLFEPAAKQAVQQAVQQAVSDVTQAGQQVAQQVTQDVTQAAQNATSDVTQDLGVSGCCGGISLGDRKVAGFTLDVRDRPERIQTSACGESIAPVPTLR